LDVDGPENSETVGSKSGATRRRERSIKGTGDAEENANGKCCKYVGQTVSGEGLSQKRVERLMVQLVPDNVLVRWHFWHGPWGRVPT
jgi:hypothetical protein